jgi:hypothetical protein
MQIGHLPNQLFDAAQVEFAISMGQSAGPYLDNHPLCGFQLLASIHSQTLPMVYIDSRLIQAAAASQFSYSL